MIAEDMPAFEELLSTLGTTFGKDVSQALRDAYWAALKDLSLSTIKAVAQQHVRYSKFFPKPVELRPREAREAGMAPSSNTEFNAICEKRNREMDWERAQRPIAFAIGFNIAHCSKQLVGLTEASLGFTAALCEYHYWLDMAHKPFDVQCAALPTFAAEHAMTPAERIERMNYIRQKRAEGIKANQLVFLQAAPQPRLGSQ